MAVRQIKGTRSYKLTNNVSGRCGGPEKSDTPNRWYNRLNIGNRSYKQGRPQTIQPPKCVSFKFYQLFHKPARLSAGI